MSNRKGSAELDKFTSLQKDLEIVRPLLVPDFMILRDIEIGDGIFPHSFESCVRAAIQEKRAEIFTRAQEMMDNNIKAAKLEAAAACAEVLGVHYHEK